MLPKLADLAPFVRQVMADVNPRMFSSLKVVDLLDRLMPVIAGREDLVTAVNNIKDDANFRVVGDIPVVPLLRLLGIPSEFHSVSETGAMDLVPLDEDEPGASEADTKAEEDDRREVDVDVVV